MDACRTESGVDGLMCTVMKRPGLDIGTDTHDDCHWNDFGLNGDFVFTDCSGDLQTIAWHASLDLDNTWGGGNYETDPEVINLGPMDDVDKNDDPDVAPFSDNYLVLVNYNNCRNLVDDGSNADCEEGGVNYNVHARVEIFVDGLAAPRKGTPDEALTKIDFVIRPHEWIMLDIVSWDQTHTTGKWQGDAIVKNAPADYKVCKFESSNCTNVEVWNIAAYETWVTGDSNAEPWGGGGTCYDYGTRE
jgi:hypothetical protein